MITRRAARLAVVALLLGAGALGVGLALTRGQPASDPNLPSCRLNVPHSAIQPMVFPTKTGAEALDAAIVGNADYGIVRRVIAEYGGFSIQNGTACSRLEAGPIYSRVLVTEGQFVGRTLWAPSLHTL